MVAANGNSNAPCISLRNENRDSDVGNSNDSLIPVSTKDKANAKHRIGGASGSDKENTPSCNSNLSNITQTSITDPSSHSVHESQTPVATSAVAATLTKDETPTKTIKSPILSRPREVVAKEISKQVLRHKLQKLRHLVLEGVISSDYLDNEIFHPKLLDLFDPQTVVYNGGIANVKEWKISCYLEVMEGGIPCTNPNLDLLDVFRPLLETCDDLFLLWYKQQHACNNRRRGGNAPPTTRRTCKRLMTFVTRYTPAPGEQALLKHVDGAGKVDGSCVVALPVDRWSAPGEDANSWYGHGGGLTFWDGREPVPKDDATAGQPSGPKGKLPRFRPREIHYETRSGDLAFIDRAVWHQADPITKGTRWALVIFYKVTEEQSETLEVRMPGTEP